ncbi:MAG: glycosyl hydrolase family 28-related protein, partial [Thermoanaerobaculales bacterium]|nr:glycosyl hydrolase family 28-related protein [Thermoanaerobaculales bacterium]
MKVSLRPAMTTIVVGMVAVLFTGTASAQWRSSLYPEGWEPGFRDGSGRFLQDFSYAGYHRGEVPLPAIDGPAPLVVDVTAPPFLADPNGYSDTTVAIREAIEFVGSHGGGIVLLPAGTYAVRPQAPGDRAALYIDHPGVVLRGEGPDRTFIVNTETAMRRRSVIRVAPAAIRDSDFAWRNDVGEPSFALTENADEFDSFIEAEGHDFAPGDWVLVMSDATDAFIAQHGMTGTWTADGIGGVTFYRRVTAVDG